MTGGACDKGDSNPTDAFAAQRKGWLGTAPDWPWWMRYGIAVLGMVAAMPLAAMAVRSGHDHHWLMFYPGIIAVGYLGGFGPALVATVLGLAAGATLRPPADAWHVAMLVVIGVLVAFLSGHAHRARRNVISQIRDRQRAEVSLKRIDERYRALFDRSLDCVCLFGFDGRILDANPAALELMGYTRDELHTLDLSKLVSGEQMRLALQRMEEVRTTGHTATSAEFELKRKDGQTVFVETRASVILHDGQPWAIQSVARDITKRRRAEEALRESEQKFRSLAENMHAAVGLVQGTRFVYANRYMAEMLGYSVEEILALEFPQLVHPIDRERMIDLARRRQMGEPVPSHYQFRALTKSGQMRWIDFSVGLTQYRGRPAIIGTGFDITERKSIEQRLKAHTRGLRFLVDSATRLLATDRPRDVLREVFDGLARHLGVGIYLYYLVCDEGGRLRLQAHLGLEPGVSRAIESVNFGQTLCGVAAQEKRRVIVEEVQRSAEPKAELVRRLGVRAYACHPLLVNNHVLGTLAVAAADRDRFSEEDLELMRATCHQAAMALEHQRLTAELRRRAGELEQASRAKDHFMAMLSHELRTPLTPVLATTSVLERDPRLPAHAREGMGMIRRNVELEARLIDDLLDVSRIVRGKIELDKHPIELCAVIRRAAEVCAEDIRARRLHFGLDLEPAAGRCWVEADATRLQQVFWNLLKNAIKFTPPEGCVGVRCRIEGGQVVVEVHDSGEGIEPEALLRIFNPFEQAERSITRQFGGLGLGLAISKALIELHGGSIEARSQGKGKGAVFRVLIPMIAPAPTGLAAEPVLPPLPSRPLRILLVEDHGDTAQVMRQLLMADGHTVETAGDVATALNLASARRFDLLISDLGLPDGSGLDLMRELRRRGEGVPGIALSGYCQEEDIRRTREAGFATHLTKPTSPERLTEAIAAVAVG